MLIDLQGIYYETEKDWHGAALLGVLGATIIEFKKVSPTAAYLLLPYLAWTTYATALTASIYQKNPKVIPTKFTLEQLTSL